MIKMTDSAMVLHDVNGGSAMGVYQQREDVRELGDRLMAMHPAAADVGAAAMRAAAQLALMLGANPLPGVNEVHIWRDNKNRPCMSLGINYWRRKAVEWGGILYETQPRPMNQKEKAEYSIADGAIAAICRGVRAEEMIRYHELGFTTNEIWDMCGRTGIGTQGANEYAKSGRPNVWTSLKRAETDMLRQLFPAEFAQVDRHTMSNDAPIITVDDQSETSDAAESREGRYTLDDLNADLGFHSHRRAPLAAGEPTDDAPVDVDEGDYEDDTPADAPMPDDELAIYEVAGKEFFSTVAELLDTDADAIKARMKALGYTAIPGKPDEKVAAYRRLRDKGDAAQDDLFGDPAPAVANGAYSD